MNDLTCKRLAAVWNIAPTKVTIAREAFARKLGAMLLDLTPEEWADFQAAAARLVRAERAAALSPMTDDELFERASRLNGRCDSPRFRSSTPAKAPTS